MISNNAADHAASATGSAAGLSAAPAAKPAPVAAPVIDLAERTRRARLGVRVHWGLLFAVGASLVLWLLIWACVRLFF